MTDTQAVRMAVQRLEKDVATVKSFSPNIATFYDGPDRRYISDVTADIEVVLSAFHSLPPNETSLVPNEPTDAMLRSGYEAFLNAPTFSFAGRIPNIWSAMLATAPSVQPDREVIERVQQMVVDCEADPDGPLMLAASVAKEHADDLRAILSALQPVAQKEEG